MGSTNPMLTLDCRNCIHNKVCAMKTDLDGVRAMVEKKSIDMIPDIPWGSFFNIEVLCTQYRSKPWGEPGYR